MAKISLVALFIDSENTSPRHLPKMLELCRSLGRLSILRCYGGTAGIKKWEKANAENYVLSMMTLASAAKANASDFALTIDAVALLHQNMFDHAVIASSDADFTQLAVHIRENGKGIHGIGEDKASQSLRGAYNTFTLLSGSAAKRAKPIASEKPTVKPVASPAAKPVAKPTATPKSAAAIPAPKKVAKLPPPAKEIPREELLRTFEKLSAAGAVSLGAFGKIFRVDHPGIELGKGKLKKMLLNIGLNVDDKNLVTRKG